jgi:hypothetical protein
MDFRIVALSLPEKEQHHARALENNLHNLDRFCQRLETNLSLYDFCDIQCAAIKAAIPKICDRPVEYFRFIGWQEIAGRDGAQAIWEFANSIHLARANLDQCEVLNSMVVRRDLEGETSQFHRSFPKAEAIRTSVAHPSRMHGTAFQIDKNAFTGEYSAHGIAIAGGAVKTLIEGMFGRSTVVTIGGEILEYELSQESLDKLNRSRLSFQSLFKLAGKLTSDHLAENGLSGVMKNPLKPRGDSQ